MVWIHFSTSACKTVSILVLFCCIIGFDFAHAATGSVDTGIVSAKTVLSYLLDDGSLVYNGEIFSPTGIAERSKIVPKNIMECNEQVPAWSREFWIYVAMSLALVLFGGLMSGLTVGMFSLDPLKLELVLRDEDASDIERRRAQLVAPLISQHHRLLVTLLLANAVAMEALPIFLDEIVAPWMAVLLSVSFVLIFGEVLPQALCTKDPLAIGARFAPIIRILMILTFPVGYPLARALDFVLGHGDSNSILFKRSELKVLVDLLAQPEVELSERDSSNREHLNLHKSGIHSAPTTPKSRVTDDVQISVDESSLSEDEAQLLLGKHAGSDEIKTADRSLCKSVSKSGEGKSKKKQQSSNKRNSALNDSAFVSKDEALIMKGALDLSRKTVSDAMKPISHVFMLSASSVLSEDLLVQIMSAGYSRIPVFDNNRHNVKGVLLVNRLIVISPEENRPLRTVPMRAPRFVPPSMPLTAILDEFQRGQTHLAVVTDFWREYSRSVHTGRDADPLWAIIGIISIEDVLEEILQEEIFDERDLSRLNLKSRARASRTETLTSALAKLHRAVHKALAQRNQN